MTQRWFWYCRLHTPLVMLRVGQRCFIIKLTKDELFSQRKGYWKAFRFKGLSFLYQKDTKL